MTKKALVFELLKTLELYFFFLEASDGRSFLIKKFQAKDGVSTEQSSRWARKEEIKNVKIKSPLEVVGRPGWGFIVVCEVLKMKTKIV